jgi:hypothetical protein
MTPVRSNAVVVVPNPSLLFRFPLQRVGKDSDAAAGEAVVKCRKTVERTTMKKSTFDYRHEGLKFDLDEIRPMRSLHSSV